MLVTFILHGKEIFLVLFYIYPIVPYASAFLNSFLLLMVVVNGIDPKRHIYLSPWYWNFSCAILYLSDSTLRISIFCTAL